MPKGRQIVQVERHLTHTLAEFLKTSAFDHLIGLAQRFFDGVDFFLHFLLAIFLHFVYSHLCRPKKNITTSDRAITYSVITGNGN